MTVTATTARPLSDRAHRIVFELALHDGDWVDVTAIYTRLGLNSHQVRSALNELLSAGMAERRRCPVRSETGCRRTHRTDFRLTDETPSEASA
ncbi:MarR family transcriptional regulator [Streptomyces sp. NPDC090493]|uniref:MarR family transcriptional regulator n=1 Tax=Streptomyces sp. NPDC090493 TaxID=3365964 RepID=UPI0037FCC287